MAFLAGAFFAVPDVAGAVSTVTVSVLTVSVPALVAGVIFAKSLEDDSTGYALTLDEAKPVLDEARSAGAEVDTGACVAG